MEEGERAEAHRAAGRRASLAGARHRNASSVRVHAASWQPRALPARARALTSRTAAASVARVRWGGMPRERLCSSWLTSWYSCGAQGVWGQRGGAGSEECESVRARGGRRARGRSAAPTLARAQHTLPGAHADLRLGRGLQGQAVAVAGDQGAHLQQGLGRREARAVERREGTSSARPAWPEWLHARMAGPLRSSPSLPTSAATHRVGALVGKSQAVHVVAHVCGRGGGREAGGRARGG